MGALVEKIIGRTVRSMQIKALRRNSLIARDCRVHFDVKLSPGLSSKLAVIEFQHWGGLNPVSAPDRAAANCGSRWSSKFGDESAA